MIPLVLCLIAFLATASFSYLLTELLRHRFLAKSAMDIPNERSMHTAPIPRGAGLAVSSAIALGLIALLFPFLQHLLAALALLVAISWLDDKNHVPAPLRLGVHLTAAMIGSFALPSDPFLFQGLLPPILDRLLLILGWAWFMNLYNFMDGIDGLTGTQSLCVAGGAGLLFAISQGPTEAFPFMALCAIVAGASAGFLIHNWHPAKIFLGDSGSIPLGFIIGFLILKLASQTPSLLLPGLLLAAYYLADSGLTLGRRLLRGEKLWRAHREHLYQQATLALGSPVPVVRWVLFANGGFIACALIAIERPWLGAVLGVGILVLLLLSMKNARRS